MCIRDRLVALLLALVCALLPVNAILWIASIMILLDMYAPVSYTHLDVYKRQAIYDIFVVTQL